MPDVGALIECRHLAARLPSMPTLFDGSGRSGEIGVPDAERCSDRRSIPFGSNRCRTGVGGS